VARGGDGAVPPPAPPLGPFLILVLARGSPTTHATRRGAPHRSKFPDDDALPRARRRQWRVMPKTDAANATRFIAVVAIFAGIRPRRRQRRRSRGDNIAIVGIVFGIDRSCRVCFNDDNMM